MHFYEKRYYRQDNEVFVISYSRSFPLRESKNSAPSEKNPESATAEDSALSRARAKMKLLAFSNPELVGFLTLTQKDSPTEEEANRRFAIFRKRVSRIYDGWRFLGVKELQKRGSIHWHLLVNFCPGKTPSQKPGRFNCKLWEYGFSDYAEIQADEKFRTELYLLKYMTKNHQKIFKSYYVRSRNLKELQPRYISTKEPLHPLAENIFYRAIKNPHVDNFLITEYTYNVSKFNAERSDRKNGLFS